MRISQIMPQIELMSSVRCVCRYNVSGHYPGLFVLPPGLFVLRPRVAVAAVALNRGCRGYHIACDRCHAP